jgi:hypothetical protein
MKQVKRNKQRVWCKTYGKPFIIRRALCVAKMAMTSSQAITIVGNINSVYGGLAEKAMAAASAIVNFSKAVNDQSSEMNKGFIKK